MLLVNGKWQYDCTPKNLPCGVEINAGNRKDECCRTVCHDKMDYQIDECHQKNKRKNRRAEYEPPKEATP